MNEKSESELVSLLESLQSEKNKIKELNTCINLKVNQFHGIVQQENKTKDAATQPGIIGYLRNLIDEIAEQRQLMEVTFKELSSIVG